MARNIPPKLKFVMENLLFVVTGVIALVCLWLTVLGKMDGEKLAIVISALATLIGAVKAKS